MGKIYNVSAKNSLVDFLAERFFEQYKSSPEKLTEVLFLLPSRRACANLREAFVRYNGKNPTILPEIRTLFDSEDDLFYSFNNNNLNLNLKPSVSHLYRSFIFTKMLLQTPQKWGLGSISTAQAYALAENLSDLIDRAYENELNFNDLKNIVREEYAEHWQQILQLLAIITQFWPQILDDKQYSDARQNQIISLYKQIEFWKNYPPKRKIVIAGTTAGFPVLKELLKTVYDFENSEIYLYELDTYLSDEDWEKIDENHPQFELKELLEFLHLKRHDIIACDTSEISQKQRFVSEIMRPSATTAEWQKIVHNKFDVADLNYLKILNCDDMRQEAYAIALIMRNTLETPEKTVALVTPDRNLARRVVTELKRWNIIADDSSGQPLHLTALGIYLRLIINVLEQNFSKTSMLALLKHPFTKCSMPAEKYKIMVYHIEQKWRNDKYAEDLTEDEETLLSTLYGCLKGLNDLYIAPTLNLRQMFEEHIKTAEKLADTAEKTGDKIIWRKEDGITAAKFVSDFVLDADILGNIASNDYGRLLEIMLSEQTVRVKFGQHPRIKILGPIEARLQKFDVTIIGEANEGKWPQVMPADMWMSRPMKKELKMPLPERAVGISASDFAHLLSGDEVYITRAEKDNGTPSAKSRWLLRLETVLAANFADLEQKQIKQAYSFIYDSKYTSLAKNFERAEPDEIEKHKIKAPAPTPPLYARPRQMSAGTFSLWMADPYIIYARYILKLYPLEKLDKPLGAVEYGNFIHEILYRFNSKYSAAYPPKNQAVEQLNIIAQNLFEEWQIPPETAAFWIADVKNAVEWIVNQEIKHRENIKFIYNEVEGKTALETKGGEFIIKARADRLEENDDGSLNIIDYKTGSIPSANMVKKGFAPQLPVEALIALSGGFANLKNKEIHSLSYWKINDKIVDFADKTALETIENAKKRIIDLIDDFDNPDTPYYSHPDPAHASKNSDYDHLSRYAEWSVKDTENQETDDE